MAQAQSMFDDEIIRESARDILEQSEFREEEAAYVIQKWLSKLGDWLGSFQDWTANHPIYTWLIIIGLLIILILLVTHIIYTAFGDSFGARKAQLACTGAGRSMEVLEGKASSWREGLDKAKSALASGQLHEAIWIGHRVLLGLLDEIGCIQFQGHKTNTTYLRELGQHHAWFDLLNRFTHTYETNVYGCKQSEVEEIRTLLGEVVTCVEESS
jgi:hypothetical protein